MRIFYAFPLPEEVADWLYKISLALREKLAGGKVTPKENLHITAAFVGNVNEIKTDILSQILREVAANNTASTLSTCPPTRLRGADLICSKIKADDALFKINSDLTRLLAQKGFNVEKRFTPHVTLMFYRAHPDYQVDAAQMLADTTKQFNTFIKIVGNYNNDTDTSMNRALNEFESQQQYTYMTYLKGMIMFGQVNEVMGDKKFEAALRKYFDTCKLKLATKDDMLACFEKSYGANISNLFNTFINGEDKTIK